MKIDDWVKKKDLHLPLLLERLQHVLFPVNVQLLIIINGQHQEKLRVCIFLDKRRWSHKKQFFFYLKVDMK